MPAYTTPGVYYERVDASAPAISVIRTDVAGFVGIAERGPVDTPMPIQSWRQFQSHFGGFTGAGFLAYAVRGFFENGGRRCWVVRVASHDPIGGARAAGILLHSPSGKEIWRVSASSPGVWGNNLSIFLKKTHRAQTVTTFDTDQTVASIVSSTDGFGRGTLVRLSQGSLPQQWKVVSDVDVIGSRLFWVHEKHELRLPYDSPLQGFNLGEPVIVESVEYTLVVRELNKAIAIYEGLSLIPEHERYGPFVLASWKPRKDFEVERKLPATPQPIVIEELQEVPLRLLEPIHIASVSAPLDDGADGLALLGIYDFIGEPISPLDSDHLKEHKRRGIRGLELVDEVAIVAAPDIHIQPISVRPKASLRPCIPDPCLAQEVVPPAPPRFPAQMELPPKFTEEDIYRVQAALVQHCEDRRDRIALLEPPLTASKNDELGIGAVRAWRSRFDSKYAAFYYPWLRVVDPLRPSSAITRDIPPTGHVAGEYARTDFKVGVHKAPANSPMVWTQDVTVLVNDAVHGILNPAGINVIRPLSGRGIRIFGARTVSSDSSWRYVNVRRLMMMIAKAIYISTQWAAFEPNNVFTRAKLRLSLTSFLIALWQQGALMGGTIEEAFFVKCDEDNNPPSERDNGRLHADVGVAPSQPFEFIVLRVGRAGNEFDITEATVRSGGM